MHRSPRVVHPASRVCLSLSLAVGLASSSGCSRSPLEAEIPDEVDETAAREGPDDTIVNELAGVRVEASVDDWGGNEEVFEHVTPVRVEITNGSDQKLRLRYEDFELQAANGEVYHALPLYKIGGTVTEPVIISDWDYTPVYEPGYYVAPYTAPFYEGEFLVYEGHWDYDPGYYDTYYRYWANINLPTNYMVQRSFPEGALGERARIVGWVYFERVPEREELEPIYLTIDLSTADDGGSLGQIRLPFAID